jgi:hypothetical protein
MVVYIAEPAIGAIISPSFLYDLQSAGWPRMATLHDRAIARRSCKETSQHNRPRMTHAVQTGIDAVDSLPELPEEATAFHQGWMQVTGALARRRLLSLPTQTAGGAAPVLAARKGDIPDADHALGGRKNTVRLFRPVPVIARATWRAAVRRPAVSLLPLVDRFPHRDNA